MNLVDFTAGEGDLELLVQLHNDGMRGSELAVFLACKRGHLPVLEHLRAIGYSFPAECMELALSNRHFAVVEWLAKMCHLRVDYWMFNRAYMNDDAQIIQFIREHDSRWNSTNDAVILNQIALEKCPKIKRYLLTQAKQRGNLQLFAR